MILSQNVDAPRSALGLPSYYGTRASSDEVIGVGQDGIFVVDDSLQILTYGAALQAGTLASLPISARSRLFGYSETLRQIASLAKGVERDTFGRVRPSDTGLAAACGVVFHMLRSTVDVPIPSDVATDRDGDIRVLWESDNRTLELVCPYEAAQRPYIYYSQGTEFAVAYDLSVYRLGQLLVWLVGSTPIFPR